MASLLEDLAQRLGTSPEQARRHLQKLLLKLRSQAQREGQATLPGLGTFSQEEGDAWTFEPTEALARSVNRSFDDLEPVGVSSEAGPVSAPPAQDDPSPKSPGPTDVKEERQEAQAISEDRPPEEDQPSEYAPPADAPARPPSSIFDRQEEGTGEEVAPRGLFTPDASEMQKEPETPEEPAEKEREVPETPGAEAGTPPVPEAASAHDEPPAEHEPKEETPVEKKPAAETAKLEDKRTKDEQTDWSLPRSPASASSETPPPAWSYAALPAGYLMQRRAELTPSDLRGGRLQTLPEAPAPENSAPETSAPEPQHEPETRQEKDAARRADAPSRPRHEREAQRGTGTRWLLTLLVLLLVALGAWYVLGRQGVVTGPVAMLQQEDTPADVEDAAPPPGNEAASGDAGTAPPPADGGAGEQDSTQADAPSPAEQAYANAPRLDRAQGGWTVVVASETSRDAAERTAQRFAQQLQGQDYPIDIEESTVDGTQRFRVVVGQFPSSDEVIRILEQDTDRFPQDAWGLQLDPGA